MAELLEERPDVRQGHRLQLAALTQGLLEEGDRALGGEVSEDVVGRPGHGGGPRAQVNRKLPESPPGPKAPECETAQLER
jgi:hypothetical protein